MFQETSKFENQSNYIATIEILPAPGHVGYRNVRTVMSENFASMYDAVVSAAAGFKLLTSSEPATAEYEVSLTMTSSVDPQGHVKFIQTVPLEDLVIRVGQLRQELMWEYAQNYYVVHSEGPIQFYTPPTRERKRELKQDITDEDVLSDEYSASIWYDEITATP